jgi:hypothetical protein
LWREATEMTSKEDEEYTPALDRQNNKYHKCKKLPKDMIVYRSLHDAPMWCADDGMFMGLEGILNCPWCGKKLD